MAYAPKVLTPPAVEPATTDEAKAHCRIDGTDEDTNVAGWIISAREMVEEFVGRALVTQTLRITLDCFPWVGNWPLGFSGWEHPLRIWLPRPPLQSISSIVYDQNTDGSAVTLSGSAYRVITDAEPGFVEPVYATVWPIPRVQSGAVRITYVAGYGLAAAVPARIKQAILLQVGLWYRDRGDGGEVRMTEELHPSVRALLMSNWTGSYLGGTR